jgi:hypothetical protein
MNSQSGDNNVLSLRLQEGYLRRGKFQLNRGENSYPGSIVVTTFETERAVTLVCNNLYDSGRVKRPDRKQLDLPESLKSGLLELVQCGKEDTTITLPCTATPQLCQLLVPPTASPKHRQLRVGVATDTTSAEWKEVLQPGLTYELRMSATNDEVWAYYTDEYGSPGEVPPAKRLPVKREESTCYFNVHDDPAPPKLFVKLEMPEKCHLSGPIPFTFVIEYSSNSDRPITINKSRSPLSVFDEDLNELSQIIDCRNAVTKEEVRWVGFFGCYDSDPHPPFPDDEDFVEILPDKPWRFECTLENLEYEWDTVQSMFGLEPGQTYETRFHGPTSFTRWQYGRRAELLSGTDEEKEQRWKTDSDRLGCLRVENRGEPVEFTVVE